MEFALPFFAFAVFVLGACIFALIVAIAVTVLARALKKSWRFSIVAALVWLVGFGVLFGLALLTARYAALLALKPLIDQHIPRSDVVGIYEARYDTFGAVGGFETLALKPDGTYLQVYLRRNGEMITNTGKWEFKDDKEWGTSVRLEGVLSPEEDTTFNKTVPKENVHTGAHSFFGRITLPIDEDLGYHYTKVMGLTGSTRSDKADD